MLGGAVVPGKPVANMYFTMYGYNPVLQATKLLADLKMVRARLALSSSTSDPYLTRKGQYTKLPPRVTFVMQFLGAIIVR